MKLSVLIVLTAGAATAQIYTSPGPSICSPTSLILPTGSTSDLQCDLAGSVTFSGGSPTVEFYGTTHILIKGADFSPLNWGTITEWTKFIAPKRCSQNPNVLCVVPGYFSFKWEDLGVDGVMRTGNFSATLDSVKMCGEVCSFRAVLTKIQLIVGDGSVIAAK